MIDAPEVLRQRIGWSIWTYTLDMEGVQVRQTGLSPGSSCQVQYMSLTREAFEATLYSRWCLGFTIVSSLLFLIMTVIHAITKDHLSAVIFYGTATLICGTLLYVSIAHVIGFHVDDPGLVPNDQLLLEKRRPSTQAVEVFVTELVTRREELLRRTYLRRAADGSQADELVKLFWLKEEGAITEDEFVRLKAIVIESEWGEE